MLMMMMMMITLGNKLLYYKSYPQGNVNIVTTAHSMIMMRIDLETY